MKLVGNLKKEVQQAESKAEVKEDHPQGRHGTHGRRG